MIRIIRIFYVFSRFLLGANLPTCRFVPTCSRYTLIAIDKHGYRWGIFLATKRILSCHPFSKRPFFDQVPNPTR